MSKLFAAFGVATLFDTLLILLVDLGYGNYDCSQKSDICRQNYLEDECDCFNGDFVKLWYRMRREEGSGITGLFITTIIYLGFFILALLLLYEYLVHVHKDGRILDIWRRITGPASEFYLPHDFEISEEELLDICSKASKWRGPNGARRKVKISSHSIADPEDSNDILHFKRYIISEFDPKSKKSSIFRQFTLDKDGMIVEVFENINNKVVGGIFGGLLGGQNQDGKSDSNMQIEVDEESEFDDQGSPALSPLHRGQSSRKLSENTKK